MKLQKFLLVGIAEKSFQGLRSMSSLIVWQ